MTPGPPETVYFYRQVYSFFTSPIRQPCKLQLIVILLLKAAIVLTLISCNYNTQTEHSGKGEDIRVENSEIEYNLPRLNLVEKVGQLLIIQLRYDENGAGITELSETEIAVLRAVQPGGVILFKENMDTVPQLMKLIADINRHVSYPPFIALDEEGGTVSRLLRSGNIPATPVPSASRIAASGKARSAYLAYSIIGKELTALGFTMNFAPVADIFSNPENGLLASRSFGSSPELVSAMVAEGVRALQEQRILSVIKHFPGHGDSSGDSHFTTPALEHDLSRLMEFEFQPFLAGMKAGAGGVLMAHLHFPEIDRLPASLSSVFITEIIRETINYDGLVITDALEMRGIGEITAHEAGVMALQAGADMLLIPPDPLRQRDAILSAVLERRLDPGVVDRAVSRIISAKNIYNGEQNRSALSSADVHAILGSEEHIAMLHEALEIGD